MIDVKEGVIKCSSGDFISVDKIQRARVDKQTVDIQERIMFDGELNGETIKAEFSVTIRRNTNTIEFRPTGSDASRRDLYNDQIYQLILNQYESGKGRIYRLDFYTLIKYINDTGSVIGSDVVYYLNDYKTKEELEDFLTRTKTDIDVAIRTVINSVNVDRDCYIKGEDV